MSRMFDLGQFEHDDADIPQRNAFLMMGAAMFGASKIHLIVQKGETSIPDRTPKFFNQMSHLLSELNDREIIVTSPFFGMTKVEMVEWFLNSEGNVQELLKTRSCYSYTLGPCGRCGACFRRWVALEHNGIKETMENNILLWDGIETYIKKVQAGDYDPQRSRETITVLKMYGRL